MKSSTKYMLAAVSVVSAVTIIKVTQRGVEKTAESINRLKFKLLVKEKLNDNPQLLNIAGDLNDDELKVLVDVFERLDPEEEIEPSALKSKLALMKSKLAE